MRPPIYDVRELQAIDTVTISCDKSSNASSISGTPSSLEKDKILAEDPRWNGKFSYFFQFTCKCVFTIRENYMHDMIVHAHYQLSRW